MDGTSSAPAKVDPSGSAEITQEEVEFLKGAVLFNQERRKQQHTVRVYSYDSNDVYSAARQDRGWAKKVPALPEHYDVVPGRESKIFSSPVANRFLMIPFIKPRHC